MEPRAAPVKPFNNTIHLFCSVLFFAAKLQGRLINFMNISCFFVKRVNLYILLQGPQKIASNSFLKAVGIASSIPAGFK